jgi:hypothetical protein
MSYMFARENLTIKQVVYGEKGKRSPSGSFCTALYRFLAPVATLTHWPVTPGIIYVVGK